MRVWVLGRMYAFLAYFLLTSRVAKTRALDTLVQESLGTITREVEPVYYPAGQWNHIYVIKPLCLHTLQTPPIDEVLTKLYQGLQQIFDNLVDTPTLPKNETAMIGIIQNNLHIALDNSVKRLILVQQLVRQADVSASTVLGEKDSKICQEVLNPDIPGSPGFFVLFNRTRYGQRSERSAENLDDHDARVEVEIVGQDDQDIDLTPYERVKRQSYFVNISATNSHFSFHSPSDQYPRDKSVNEEATRSEKIAPFSPNQLTDSRTSIPRHEKIVAHEVQPTTEAPTRAPGQIWQRRGPHVIQGDEPDLGNIENQADYIKKLSEHIAVQWRENCVAECLDSNPRIHSVLFQPHNTPRHKRSVVPAVGKLYNWLWGTATEEQVQHLQNITYDLSASLDRTTSYLNVNYKSMSSMIALIQNHTEVEFQAVADRINEVITHMSDWHPVLDDALNTIDINKQLLYTSQASLAALVAITNQDSVIEQLIYNLRALEDYYQELRWMLQTGYVSPKIIQPKVIISVLQNISKQLPANQVALMPHLDHQVVGTKFQTAYERKGLLYIHMMYPVVRKTDSWKFWVQHAIPIFQASRWMQVHVSSDVLITNRESTMWSTMTLQEYQQCASNPKRICPNDPIIHGIKQIPCAIALVISETRALEICSMAILDEHVNEKIRAIPLSPYSWIVSTTTTNVTAIQRCISASDSSVQSSVVTIPQLGRVDLPPNCEMVCQDMILRSYSLDHFSQLNIQRDIDIPLYSNITVPVIKDYSLNSPIFQHFKHLKFSLSGPMNNTLFHDNHLRIQQLLSTTRSQSQSYLTDMDKLRDKVMHAEDELSKTYSYVVDWSAIWNNVYWRWFIISALATCVLFLILCLWVKCGKSCTWASPLVAHEIIALTDNRPHGAFATPTSYVGTNVYNLSSNITRALDQVSPLLSGETPHNAVHPVVQHIYSYAHLYMHLGIMLTAMVICHMCLAQLIKRMAAVTQRRLGYIIRNKTGAHHPGEAQLVLGLLLEFRSWRGLYVQCKELQVSLCTVPGKASRWYCDVTGDLGNFLDPTPITRWVRHGTFRINWGPICLRHPDMPNVDTCQELPAKITLRVADLAACLEPTDTIWWWTVHLVGITGVNLQQGSVVYSLYDYHAGVVARAQLNNMGTR